MIVKGNGCVAGKDSFEGTERQQSRQQISRYNMVAVLHALVRIKRVQIRFLSLLFFKGRRLCFHITQHVE